MKYEQLPTVKAIRHGDPAKRGSILMVVLIFGIVLSIVGFMIITVNSQSEITSIKEVNITRANYLADAGLEWGKLWISSQCVAQNRMPESISGHANFFEIGQVDPVKLQDPANSGKGFFTVGIVPIASSTNTYLLVSTGTVSTGAFGNTIRKAKGLMITLKGNNGVFTPAGSMITKRFSHAACLLADGRVLFTGGTFYSGGLHLATRIEVFDPATGTFTALSPRGSQDSWPIATLLSSANNPFYLNKVLIAEHQIAELYDPATGACSQAGSYQTIVPPAVTRSGFTSTLLKNGNVLIAGGGNDDGSIPASEWYDTSIPAWHDFTVGGHLNTPRSRHTATVLSDTSGYVLIAGGYDLTKSDGSNASRAELYDPVNRTFSICNNDMICARIFHTATLLPNGKVLFTGGLNKWTSGASFQASSELYDPVTKRFTATGSMNYPRMEHAATLLSNGKVLITGGRNNTSSAIAACELYDPATGTFTSAGNLTKGRCTHTATLLANGKVLIAGGKDSWTNELTSAELYESVISMKMTGNSYIEW